MPITMRPSHWQFAAGSLPSGVVRARAGSRPAQLSGEDPPRPMHRPDKSPRRGFTLLEVLVGIAILAMAAVVLGAAYVNTLGAHEAVARRAAAGTGMDYLRDIILNEPERAKVEQGGNLALPDNRQMNWEAVVEEAAVPDLFRVLVRGRITGTAAKDSEDFEQALMLLRPSWSDAGKREQIREDWDKQREAEARR